MLEGILVLHNYEGRWAERLNYAVSRRSITNDTIYIELVLK